MLKILFIHAPEFQYQTHSIIEAINRSNEMQALLCTQWDNNNLDQSIPPDIDLLVTIHSRQYILKEIINFCRAHKIASVTLQDGIIDYKHWNIVAPDRYNPLLTDYIFVFGRTSSDLLKARGVDEKRIFVTGCPRFDPYTVVPTTDEYVLITCANSPYHSYREKITLWFQFLKLALYFKAHRYPFHFRLPEKLKKKTAFRCLQSLEPKQNRLDMPLIEDLSRASLICTTMSTLVLEGLCLKKPVIIIKNHQYPLYINTPILIEGCLSKIPTIAPSELTFGQPYQKLLVDNVSYPGQATEKVIGMLHLLAQESDREN